MKIYYARTLAISLLIALGTLSVSAQTYVNLSASGANDGTSWANAYNDLTTALANTTSGEIWVAAGIYHPGEGSPDTSSTFKVINTVSLYGGFAGTETSNGEQNPVVNPTVLSGDINNDDVQNNFVDNKSDNIQHVIVVDSLLGPVTIDGFDIIGGHTSDINSQDEFFWRGGGIISYSTVHIANCDFRHNFARSGACVYVSPNGGGGGAGSTFTNCKFASSFTTAQSSGIYLNQIPDVTVTDCEFTDNQTTRGAFYPFMCNNLSISNCLFDNNLGNAIDGFGGAMFIWRCVGLSITDCTFTNNRGGNGGAVFYNGATLAMDANNLVFENCSFSDNQSTDFGGGAVYTFDASSTMNNCTFTDNMGLNGASAFFAGANKNVVVSNSTFTGGAANFGGAHNCYGANSFYTLENNTYTTGVANTSGGALIIGFMGNASINNCTFDQNTANFGGAVYTQNDSTFVNYSNCNFESNIANNFGGSIYQGGGVAGTYDKCEFILNVATETAGAIHATTFDDDQVAGSIDLSNCIFNFNSSTNQAGALNLNDIDASIENSLFINNSVSNDGVAGGAISINAGDTTNVTTNLINSTFSNNIAPLGAGIGTFTTENESFLTVNVQNNMFFEVGNNYEVEAGTPVVNSTGGNISNDASTIGVFNDATDQHEIIDPLFKDAINFDYHLTAASPAVDAGVDDNAPLTDIEGNARIGAVDAGAYEFDPTTGVNTILADNSTLAILPNPVEKELRFELSNDWTGPVKAYIYSTNGQLLNKWSISKGGNTLQETVSVAALTAGSYRLMVQYGNQIVSQQFVKL